MAAERRWVQRPCAAGLGLYGNAGLRLRSRPNQGRKHMQIEQLFTLAFAAMVVVLVLGFAAMHS